MPEQNETYRRLVELSPDGILISQDGFLVFANPAAARLCGATPDDLLGRAVFDLSFLATGSRRDHLAWVMDRPDRCAVRGADRPGRRRDH